MLKPACDKCGGECRAAGNQARALPELDGQVGLEVVPLVGGQRAPGNFLCDECAAALLVSAVVKMFATTVAARTLEDGAALRRGRDEHKRRRDLEVARLQDRSDDLDRREAALKLFREEHDERVRAVEQRATVAEQRLRSEHQAGAARRRQTMSVDLVSDDAA